MLRNSLSLSGHKILIFVFLYFNLSFLIIRHRLISELQVILVKICQGLRQRNSCPILSFCFLHIQSKLRWFLGWLQILYSERVNFWNLNLKLLRYIRLRKKLNEFSFNFCKGFSLVFQQFPL